MSAKWFGWSLALCCLAASACSAVRSKSERVVPLPPGASPDDVRDPFPPGPVPAELGVQRFRAEQRRATEGPTPKPGEKYDLLVLTGIGSRSLYAYGVLSGWADSGTMPDFQVITGVGGGAYGAIALFAGREYLTDLRRIWLGFDQRKLLHGDAWDAKRFPHPFGVGTPSVATTTKIRQQTRTVLTPEYFAKVTAEHAKGRRLYVGTTNLDTQRFVVWDMGAIASEGTAESRKLFEDVLVASTAVPPLLEPSRIAVAIDGTRHEEMHLEGGVTRSLFWQPPSDWAGDDVDRRTGVSQLAGARVHVVLGNSLYNGVAGTKPTLLDVTLRSMKAMLLAIQRADLARLYSECQDRDMGMRWTAIPDDFQPSFPTDEFDPAKTAKLFCEGYTRGHDGRAWDDRPPERADSERRPRRGVILTTGTASVCPPLPVTPIRAP